MSSPWTALPLLRAAPPPGSFVFGRPPLPLLPDRADSCSLERACVCVRARARAFLVPVLRRVSFVSELRGSRRSSLHPGRSLLYRPRALRCWGASPCRCCSSFSRHPFPHPGGKKRAAFFPAASHGLSRVIYPDGSRRQMARSKYKYFSSLPPGIRERGGRKHGETKQASTR